jgi:CheY-like chemotaxis protein
VADTGIGISPEKQHIIFQPFEQADTSTTRTHGGTGLGLAICHRLLTMMGSRMELTSQINQGSTFWFDLLLPVSVAKKQPDPSSRVRTSGGHIPAAAGLRVLIVEDLEMNQIVVTGLLKELGHQAAAAGDGSQALALLREHGPRTYFDFDLVLMDIQMPGMDGVETTAELRRLEAENNWPPIPVVALTAHAMKGDREKYLAAGMDDYLTKPILLDELAGLMDRLAPKLRSRAAALQSFSRLPQGQSPPPSGAPAPPDRPPVSKAAGLAPPASLMDEELIELSFGNNQDLLKKSMEIFLRDAPNLMTGIKAAIGAGDFKQTSALAHSLKGIISYFTKGGPFELARLTDMTARNEPGPEMKAELITLSTALEQAVAALTSTMNERLKDRGGREAA